MEQQIFASTLRKLGDCEYKRGLGE